MGRSNRYFAYTRHDQWPEKISLIKINKIAVIDHVLARGLLGKLSNEELQQLNDNLKIVLQLH